MSTDQSPLSRITFDPDILGGKPIIRGLRISVAMILELLAKGASNQEILEDYPDLVWLIFTLLYSTPNEGSLLILGR